MALYFLTGSKEKFGEMKAILGDVEQWEVDLQEIQDLDARKIIETKLHEARKQKSGTFIVEDTSLYLAALNGLPGPLIKWFMKSIGNEGLFKIAETFGNYKAEAKTIIGYSSETGTTEFFEGVFKGNIVQPRGKGGFGWDPVFQPEGYEKTFAELDAVEKNFFSMRKVAAEKLREYLKSK